MNITLRQLEVFVAVAAHGHVGKAADALGVSQSAVSMALSDFERSVGERLFDRVSRSVLLNERGRALLPRSVAVIEQAREIEEEGSRGGRSGHIRVGASTTVGNYLLPGIIGSFASAEPGIRVSLEVGNTSEIAARLEAHAIDLAFVEGPVSDTNIAVSRWMEDELVAFAAPNLVPPVPEPEGMQWIMREPGSGTREVFERAMAQAGLAVHVRMELGHTEAIKKAVEAGLGYGCLSRLAVERELALGYLAAVSMPEVDLKRELSMLLLSGKHVTATLGAFMEFCCV